MPIPSARRCGRPPTPRWPNTANASASPCPAPPWPARALIVLGLSRKKKSLRASEQDRPDVKTQRDEWKAGQATLDSTKYVFLDETWASTAMTRTHGRAPRGQRLVMDVPHGHWKTTTFVAALRLDGLTAPTVVDGAMTGDIFVAYIRQQLIPTLKPGDVVVMDNLSCHKRAEMKTALEAAGVALRYLPPSPKSEYSLQSSAQWRRTP
jgi:hypothetical protein